MKIKMLLLLCATALSACSTQLPTAVPFEDEVPVSTYQIGNNDQLFIDVWQNKELSLSVSVRPDGKISMPLIGDVQAEGLTPETLSSIIAEKLNKYVRAPNVTVIVTAANSAIYNNRIRITGAVNAPRSIPFYKNITVLDLVLDAGGLTDFANADKAVLYRKTPEGIEAYPVNVDEILNEGILTTNFVLRPADILIIPESVF